MSILTFLSKLLKTILPFLRSAAEKAFKSLPKDQQDKLIQVSKLVQIIKLAHEAKQTITTDQLQKIILDQTGLTPDEAEAALLQYWKDKGKDAKNFGDAVTLILQDAEQRTETGLKSLWSGLMQLVSTTVAEIDWQALLYGVGEFVYEQYVKGKVKI